MTEQLSINLASDISYKLNDMIPVRTNWTSEDFYNAEDLNRVEANTEFVAEYIKSLQYNVPELVIRTDRDITSIDFISSINRLEQNIEALKNGFITPPGWQSKKVWTLGMGFDYNDANRLEKNLKLLYKWAQIAKENLIYCGTFSCGEDVI